MCAENYTHLKIYPNDGVNATDGKTTVQRSESCLLIQESTSA